MLTDNDFDMFRDRALSNYVKDGKLSPILIAFAPGRPVMLASLAALMNGPRPFMYAMMRRTLKEYGAVSYIIMSEAWMSVIDAKNAADAFNPDGSPKVMPRNDPKKIEIISIVARYADAHIRCETWEIGHGKIIGLHAVHNRLRGKKGQEMAGEFATLLD